MVTNVTSGNPSYCLNADNSGGLFDGVPMQLWTCNLSSNDLWEVGICATTSDDVSFCQLRSVWNTGYCLNADDTNGLYNGSFLQLWTCNTSSPYNDLWTSYESGGQGLCYNVLASCFAVADKDNVAKGPFIATVDLGNGTPGDGTPVWMWLAGDEKYTDGIIWAAQVNGEPVGS
jgi:hypothetical protein